MIYNVNARTRDWHGDVMLVDPPYSEHTHTNATSQSAKGGARHRDLGFDHITDDIREFTCKIAAGTRKWSCIFSDVESNSYWIEGLKKAGATPIRIIPWVRWSMPSLCGWPPQGSESIIVAYGWGKGKKEWFGPGNLTHFDHKCMRGENKHKTQKPLDLMLDLVLFFSEETDTIIDPFAGSGTTGLAAHLLGRKFVGTEIDAEWADKALKREDANNMCERDRKCYDKWLISQTKRQAEMERMAINTAKIRAKLDANKKVEVLGE